MRLNRNGFTLVEIVVAIGLLGIIAVLFLTAFSGQFSMFSRTRQITDNLFRSQEIIEKDIDNIKTKLVENPGSISNPTISYNLFSGIYSRQVSGFVSDTLSHSSDTRLVAVVSDGRLPAFPVPEIVSVDLKIDRNGTLATHSLDNHENVASPGLSLKATSDIEENSVYYTSRHEWYVSNPGFNIPVIPTSDANYDVLVDSDLDLGRLYPIFPNDYSPIPIEAYSGMSAESILASLSETYAGRHIIYKITPFAASGRMGDSVVSDPVFMSGPAVNSGKILHLDASLISKADFNPTSGSLVAINNKKVKKWKNSSGNNNDAVQNNTDLMPSLTEVNYSDSSFVWGKALTGETTSARLNIPSFVGGSSLGNYTVVLTAKRINAISHNILTAKNGGSEIWKVGYTNNDLVFDASGTQILRNLGVDDSWHIYMFDIKSDGTVSIYIDDENTPSAIGTISTGHSISDLSIDISSSFELSEIIIYRDLTSANFEKIRTFLNDKYHPDPSESAVTINYLLPVTDQILLKGDPGTGLPSSVLAHMTNGSVQNVPVTWDGGYDPSVVGTYSITGRSVMDSTKTITTTVHVLGIDGISISPSSVNINEGSDYPLPIRLPATASNSSISRTIDVLVNWFDVSSGLPGSPISNLNTLGPSIGSPHTIRAYADADDTKYADLSAEVIKYVPVEGISLNKSSLSIVLDQTDSSLIATIRPADATNKNMSWESSNTNAIEIIDTGVPGTVQLKALNKDENVNPVISTITVKTDDGSYSASCIVTVQVPLKKLEFSTNRISISANSSTDNLINYLQFSPLNANNKNVSWSSTGNYTSINTTTGRISAGSYNGTDTITARSLDNNSIIAQISVQVTGGCNG